MSVLYLVFFLLRKVLYIVCEFRNTDMYAFFTLCLLGNFACFIVICFFFFFFFSQNHFRERSGSVVECLTRDRRAAGSSLTGVTALWSLSKTHLS